jgi:alpha 1,3-glucosidase
MSFTGADVGGFFGDPDRELYVRWQQTAAAMYPFFRCHAHIDSKYREPWVFDDEVTVLVREAIDMRYRMMPYWYTQFSKYAMDGTPSVRPIWFDD